MSLVWFLASLRRMFGNKVMVAVLAGVQPNAYPIIVKEYMGEETLQVKYNKTPFSFRIDRSHIKNWFGVPTILLDFKTMCSLPQRTTEPNETINSPQDLDAYWVSLQNLTVSLEAERKKKNFFEENLPFFTLMAAIGALALAFLAYQAASANGNTLASIAKVLSPLISNNASVGVVIKPI